MLWRGEPSPLQLAGHPRYGTKMEHQTASERTKLFISKATPGDDAFALWLAPRLEAEGYAVFADILHLEPAQRWRARLTDTLQNEAQKLLLCCSDETLARQGVQEEIEIASDLTRELGDEQFIVPLRLKRFKKLFGIGGLQYINFEESWAEGLAQLLDFLEKQNVARVTNGQIQPNWSTYLQQRAVKVEDEPEVLTSNWLRVLSAPDHLNFLVPSGFGGIPQQIDFPAVPFANGLITFSTPEDFFDPLSDQRPLEVSQVIPFADFAEDGCSDLHIDPMDARRMVVNLMRQAWELHCVAQGFLEHRFSNGAAHIVTENQVDIGRRIQWGRQGQRRSSMLRNVAKKKVWEYGVSAIPSLFPFPHFRLKSRVLFSDFSDNKKGAVLEDQRTQFRLRRSVCSVWRNKAWHGRLMAFMELLAGESPYVSLRVGNGKFILLDAMPIQATSPVTARQTNRLDEDAEEKDASTLGGYFSEEDA